MAPSRRGDTTLRRNALGRVLLGLLGGLLIITGCGPKWHYSYIDAERVAKDEERDVLICYRDHLDVGSGDLDAALKSSVVSPYIKGDVRCSLVSAYTPNRRYMAQFGVSGPPAVVLLHKDGTYHAKTEDLTPQAIATFLKSAEAPGERPQRDFSVPRATDFLFRAEGVYETAVEKSRRLNRDLLIVYKWWLDEDSTKLIARMSRPEVAARCANTINCVLDWDYVPNRANVAKYGVNEYPALIVVRRDGSFDVLEGLVGVDRITGFLNRALSTNTGYRTEAPYAVVKPGWQWSTDLALATQRARRSGKGLFVFFLSPGQDSSARTMRLLQSETASAILDDAVKCSVDATAHRRQLEAYGVDQSPACIGIRPDGATIIREGSVTLDDLRNIRKFLDG